MKETEGEMSQPLKSASPLPPEALAHEAPWASKDLAGCCRISRRIGKIPVVASTS